MGTGVRVSGEEVLPSEGWAVVSEEGVEESVLEGASEEVFSEPMTVVTVCAQEESRVAPIRSRIRKREKRFFMGHLKTGGCRALIFCSISCFAQTFNRFFVISSKGVNFRCFR